MRTAGRWWWLSKNGFAEISNNWEVPKSNNFLLSATKVIKSNELQKRNQQWRLSAVPFEKNVYIREKY
jgi:hypothetical protein